MWCRFLERFDFSILSKFSVWFKLTLLLVVGVVAVFVLAKLSWAWIVPKIFPNMVGKGWLPESLTYFQILKLFLFFGFLNLNSFTKEFHLIWKEYFESLRIRLMADLLTSIIFLIVVGFLVFISWNWVMADVFSKAVAYNLIPSYLSFWNSILLVFLCWFIGLTGRNFFNIFENKK